MLQAIRGMNDILPAEAILWQQLQTQLMTVLAQYGYQEIRLPILEYTELFARSIGAGTDVVEKEMYTFADRNGESLTLRPEGTAGCVRAAIEHGLLHNQTQRLWYVGAMFRHERPQKGRYRQFHQLGIEAFGIAEPSIDIEVIALTARFWKALGIADKVKLTLNTLGTPEVRAIHRHALIQYFQSHYEKLDEDSQRRLDKNPLRILDSKNPALQALIAAAPKLTDFLDPLSERHFHMVKTGLDALGIIYEINPCLVRGLDYYTHTVFEWVTDTLGAQGTVCGGGRYDGLVAECGGTPTPAFGCAMGLERLLLMTQNITDLSFDAQHLPHVYMVGIGMQAQITALKWAEALRQQIPMIRVMVHCGSEGFKSQFKKADKSGAVLALIFGEEELANGEVSVKFLRQAKEQERVPQTCIIEVVSQNIL